MLPLFTVQIKCDTCAGLRLVGLHCKVSAKLNSHMDMINNDDWSKCTGKLNQTQHVFLLINLRGEEP